MTMRAVAVLALSGGLAAAACAKPKPVEIAPRSAMVTSVSSAGLVLALELEAKNPNSFAVDARSVEGKLFVGAPPNSVEVGRGTSTPASSIPAEGTSLVPATLTVGWTNLAALAPFALSNRPAPYRFEGVATVHVARTDFRVPFTATGELSREKLIELGLGLAGGR